MILENGHRKGGKVMFVKQIDEKTALQLAAKGENILVLELGNGEDSWKGATPYTMQDLLSGLMFFRREPAMEIPLLEPEEAPHLKTDDEASTPEEVAECENTGTRKKRTKVSVDTGKMMALRKAGWSMKKIAEELRVSEGTVFNYLKKMEEHDGEES